METLIKLLETYGGTAVLIMFLLFILVVLGCYEIFCKFRDILDKYHKKRSTSENKEDELNNRFEAIETTQEEHHKQIMSLKSEVNNIKTLIENVQETQKKSDADQKRANRAQSRSSIMRLSNELIAKGYMSETESETLNDLVSVFMQSAADGDTYVIPTLTARALKLPVLTQEELDRQMNKRSNTYGKRRLRFSNQ